MIEEQTADIKLFLKDKELLFDNGETESYNKLPLLIHEEVNSISIETNYLRKPLEEIHHKIDNNKNEFIDSEEYISLILENQLFLNCNMNNRYSENKDILRKYFNLWKQYTVHSDGNTLINNAVDRTEMINSFFENIIKKNNNKNSKIKNHNSEDTSDSSSNSKISKEKYELGNFHHRFKAQKNVIALQKMKIQQQERIIEGLKLKKIVEDVGASSNIVSDVKKTLQYCDRNLKPKLKCIIGEEENSDHTDEKITPYCTKVPKFIQQMEQRARQREEKRAIVRERRRQIDLEKQRAKEQMELEKQIMDQEEKNRRLNEYKEKRKQEQLIAIRRKEWIEKIRALNVMADLHYERKLMVKYGVCAFQKYLTKMQQDYDLAVKHELNQIIKNNFHAWKNYTKTNVNRRIVIAERFHHRKIWKWVFQEFKIEYHTMIKKWQVAEDWYEFHVTERLFLTWRHNTRKIKYYRRKQWNLAIHHYNIQLLWRVMGCWQMLPTINKLEREHESRKQKWRLKVQQVLPDFIPQDSDGDDIKYI